MKSHHSITTCYAEKSLQEPYHLFHQSLQRHLRRLAHFLFLLFLFSLTSCDHGVAAQRRRDRKTIPLLSAIPETAFSCRGHNAGYYADMDTGCQVYHMCDTLEKQYSYLCPNYTLFNQKFMICDHWYMVNCSTAGDYYELNDHIGEVSSNNEAESNNKVNAIGFTKNSRTIGSQQDFGFKGQQTTPVSFNFKSQGNIPTKSLTTSKPRFAFTNANRTKITATNRPTINTTIRPKFSTSNRPKFITTSRPKISTSNQFNFTNRPKITNTNRPNSTTTNRPRFTFTNRPKITNTNQPNLTMTNRPRFTFTNRPKITNTNEPNFTTTNRPKFTFTNRPKTTNENRPNSTTTRWPKITTTNRPITSTSMKPRFTNSFSSSFPNSFRPPGATNQFIRNDFSSTHQHIKPLSQFFELPNVETTFESELISNRKTVSRPSIFLQPPNRDASKSSSHAHSEAHHDIPFVQTPHPGIPFTMVPGFVARDPGNKFTFASNRQQKMEEFNGIFLRPIVHRPKEKTRKIFTTPPVSVLVNHHHGAETASDQDTQHSITTAFAASKSETSGRGEEPSGINPVGIKIPSTLLQPPPLVPITLNVPPFVPLLQQTLIPPARMKQEFLTQLVMPVRFVSTKIHNNFHDSNGIIKFQFPVSRSNRDFFIPPPGLSLPEEDEKFPVSSGESFENQNSLAGFPQHKKINMTMVFPAPRHVKFTALKLNPDCPKCHPAFLKPGKCTPCVLIR